MHVDIVGDGDQPTVKKTDCPDCMKLLESFRDIPTTLERTKAVWATQECKGKHTLDEWVADPT